MKAQSPRNPRRILSRALKIYLGVFAGLWCLSLLSVAIHRFVLHHGYPFNTFLLVPAYRFSDFTIYDDRFALWGHGDRFFSLPGFLYDYPAPMLVVELAFYKLTNSPLNWYLGSVGAFALAGGIVAVRARQALAAAAILLAAVFSFPLYFLIDRANVEGLVWIVASLGILLFVLRRFTVAALLLALAASMKIFPGVLLLLLLAKKRYRDFGVSIAASAAFTAVSLWIAGPTPLRAAQGIADGMKYLREIQIFAYKPVEIGFDHSLYGFLKQILFRVLHDAPRVNALLPRLYLGYGVFAIALFAALYFAFIRRLPALNQLIALSALSVLLPFVSYDYTLVHMFAPFAALVVVLADSAGGGRLKLTAVQLLCLLLPFAVIFTPQSYLVVSVVGYGAQLKALALLAVEAAAILIPLPSALFNELAPPVSLSLNLVSIRETREPQYTV